MVYIKYNDNGEYGFYIPEVHGEEFCENECIKITDEFYNYLLDNNGKYLINADSIVDTVTKENLVERPIEPQQPREKTQLEILQEAVDMLVLDSLGVL